MTIVIKKVIKSIEEMDGVLKAEHLSNEDIKNLIDIEANRDNDLIPVINEGLQECFKKDFNIVIFKDSNFRNAPFPTVLLVNTGGKILGHEIISIKDREKFKKKENVHFLSDDFVIYKDTMNNISMKSEKEYFLLPPIEFPELLEIEEVFEVVSSSPSTKSDDYLKNKYGYLGNSKVATIIVGFSLKIIN